MKSENTIYDESGFGSGISINPREDTEMSFYNWLHGSYGPYSARSEWLYEQVVDGDYDAVTKYCEGAYEQGKADAVAQLLRDIGYDSSAVKDLSKEKQAQAVLAMLKVGRKVLQHQMPEASGDYFIAGELGGKVTMNLPRYIRVCPALGSDTWALYEFNQATGPAW